jgi:hypothetical protein
MTVVEGTGHLSPLEVPEQIAKELDQLTNSFTVTGEIFPAEDRHPQRE